MNKTLKTLSTIALVVAGVAALVAIEIYQFHVYQKKHGEQMTYTDFLLDSRK